MTEGNHVDFTMLDVGCGTKPKGDVNLDLSRTSFNSQESAKSQGQSMAPRGTKNFVVADALHLPFKDASFSSAISIHTIEHVSDPLLMLREMCRVAKRKVIVRCHHRKGSEVVTPHHLNYFDEDWFKKASDILGFASSQFILSYEPPTSPKLKKIFPNKLQKTPPWKALRIVENAKKMEKFRIPVEMEVWVRKRQALASSAEVKFVVVYNDPEIFKNRFSSSPNIPSNAVTAYYNINNEPLPKLFNKAVQEHSGESVWFAFCHQDFILREDLHPRLKGKFPAVYGPIGAHLAEREPYGRIIQTDGVGIGREIAEDAPVQTLDEMCLIVHSEVFRQGLSFDERFRFHFYGADFCMQAYVSGFNVLAMQLQCQHKSRTLHGDITSSEYLSSLSLFKEKWNPFLPIKTTTKLIK